MKTALSILTMTFLLSSFSAWADSEASGRPFLNVITSDLPGVDTQNWEVAQDSDGIVFIANSEGVLEFDGSSWRLYGLDNGSIARSLAVGAGGLIYVGGVGEIGVLEHDGTGTRQYRRLRIGDRDPALEGLRDVWRMWPTDDGFVAWAFDRILAWNGSTLESWPVSGNGVPGMVAGRFIHVDETGVLRLFRAGKLEEIGRLVGVGEERIVSWIGLSDGRVLAGTRQGHLWQVDFDAIVDESTDIPRVVELSRFYTDADTYLEQNRFYHGIGLSDGGLALSTMDGGALVLDEKGQVRHLLNRSAGLPDDSVWYLFEDRDGGLWLALNRGLARAELQVPFAVFREDLGLEGTVESLSRGLGSLWAATSRGLFRLGQDRFRRIDGVPGPCWSLLTITVDGSERLLVGANGGLFEVGNGDPRLLYRARHVYSLAASETRPGLVWVGGADGITSLRAQGGDWLDPGFNMALGAEVRSIAETDDGALWLGTLKSGAMTIEVGAGEQGLIHRRNVGIDEGLGRPANVKVFTHQGSVYFATAVGLKTWDEDSRRARSSDLFGSDVGGIMRVAAGLDSEFWLTRFGDRCARVSRVDGVATVVDAPFYSLPLADYHALLPEKDGSCWIGGISGLYRFNGRKESTLESTSTMRQILVRGLTVAGEPRQVSGTANNLEHGRTRTVVRWMAPSYGAAYPGRYRYRMRGLDEAWSKWTDQTRVEYASLPVGQLTFEVEGRDLRGLPLKGLAIPLRVSGPWYYTGPAFVVWGVLFAACIWAVAGIRSRQVQKDRDRLEGEVEIRTSELREYALHLEEAHTELEAFSYSISHDLRAPLRRIDGFSQALLEDHAEQINDEGRFLLDRLRYNSQRMAELIDAVLGLSRISRHDLAVSRVDISKRAEEVVDELRAADPERRVEITVEPGLSCQGDHQLLGILLRNMIGNAWKFTRTRETGRIEVGSEANDDNGSCFVISDNGAGFDSRFADRLFGPFQRLHSADDYPGTGIGLATVQRIVRRHGGRVWAEGAVDRGATFRFTIPE